jgi:hypothetical protein
VMGTFANPIVFDASNEHGKRKTGHPIFVDRSVQMSKPADLVKQAVHETLTYHTFPDTHGHALSLWSHAPASSDCEDK